MQTDTIAAIATPLGAGGIGTVRLSGERARQIADRVFRPAAGTPLAELAGYRAAYGTVYDGEARLDEAVALVFAAPKSYTGEDVVELSVHGGRLLVQQLLRVVLAAGARLAEPGEFTERAFCNGKLDLVQAESVMNLIGAQGTQELRLAQAARTGAVSRQIDGVRQTLLEAASQIAAFSDYPDEDLPALSLQRLTDELNDADAVLAGMLYDYDAGRVLREGVDTAIVGRPNVGKSTLMNLLSGVDRSIVTPVAGTTRDVIEETVRVGEVTLRLADTAGLRETEDAVEAAGVALAAARLERAQLVLAVFDASEPLTDDDKALLDRLKYRPHILICNKTDLAPGAPPPDFGEAAGPVVFLSAKTGEGQAELCRAVAEVTGTAFLNPDAAVLCSERQRAQAERAYLALRDAQEALQAGMTLDAVGVCIDDALAALLSLTGERVSEAVTREVFSRFCVGK